MTTDQRTLFPEPAIIVRSNQYLGGDKEQKGARFPWIHNKGAVDLDFQSVDISPSKNHDAVP
jgi:hypothetical protein